MDDNHNTPQWLKRPIVGILGRNRANKLTAPYYDWRARLRTKQFLQDLPATELRINLGCGYRPMKGWINVDRARGPEVQVVWDLSLGLPFPDESCSAIFSEHLIEHLTKEDAKKLLCECHRVLQPAGVLRLSTPDAELFLRSYAGDRKFLAHPQFSEAIDTPIDRVNQMMREHGQHLCTYDEELLVFILKQTGFRLVVRQRFGVSAHPLMNDIDSEARAFESLYVEGIKERAQGGIVL